MIMQFRRDVEEAGINFRGPTMLHVYLALSLSADCTNLAQVTLQLILSDLVQMFSTYPLLLEDPKKISPGARARYQRPCYSVVYILQSFGP
jgi:hypothetical protein